MINFILTFTWNSISLSSTNKTAKSTFQISQDLQFFTFFSWWVSMCLFSRLDNANDFSHLAHLCGFSPEWMAMCLFRSIGVDKDFPQSPQECGFSPVWVSMILRRRQRLAAITTFVWLLPFVGEPGVSIIFKIWVIYKAWFERYQFFSFSWNAGNFL